LLLEKHAVQFGALVPVSDRSEIMADPGDAVAFDEDVKKKYCA
jgi:hypothetical protein